MKIINAIVLFAGALTCFANASAQAAPMFEITFLYIKNTVERGPVLSNVLLPPEDRGIPGARLGIEDSNTTGRFLNHRYTVEVIEDNSSEVLRRRAKKWIDDKRGQLILADLPAAALLQLKRDIGKRAIVLNVAARDDALRTTDCQSLLLHTIPSRAMLADALGQFLIARKWREWLLVRGPQAQDIAFADALKRSAKRYGGKVVDERTWTFDTDLRRSAQQELPLFTQARKYDVVLVADESGDVGEYLPYNTWLPRPVAGTQGLTPVTWHRVVEQWGAAQLQNRFQELAGRPMTEEDYAAWIAVRAIAEAVTRTQSADLSSLYAYLFDTDYELAGFKGRKLSFRPWNGQLRQPIPLVQPRALISQSPQTGFLHPATELDTLGFDRPESTCQFRTTL